MNLNQRSRLINAYYKPLNKYQWYDPETGKWFDVNCKEIKTTNAISN